MYFQIEDWGVNFPIKKAVAIQDEYWAEKVFKNKENDQLIFVEHEPVYTAGASLAKNLAGIQRCFKKEIWELPAPIEIIGRGGLVTYQGPGILSVYCIFEIKNMSISNFENALLDSAAACLKTYGVETRRRKDNPGLYIGKEKKIASVGLQISRGVTRYGMTVSLVPEEKYLEPLIPCGLKDVRITSMAEELNVKSFSESEKDEIKIKLATELISRYHKPRSERMPL